MKGEEFAVNVLDEKRSQTLSSDEIIINLPQPCRVFEDSAGRKLSHAAAVHVLRHRGGITMESAVICTVSL